VRGGRLGWWSALPAVAADLGERWPGVDTTVDAARLEARATFVSEFAEGRSGVCATSKHRLKSVVPRIPEGRSGTCPTKHHRARMNDFGLWAGGAYDV
jgi:hypothetical protein